MRIFLVTLGICSLTGPGPTVASTILPDFAAATFEAGAPVDNPWFPLGPGYARVLTASGIDEDGETFRESTELSFHGPGRTILGVRTTALRDRAYEDGILVEDTFDYFAQDTAGNVWYFGEDVTNYVYDDDDKLVSTNSDSAWIAGERGARPGYIMPVEPTEGASYYQEFAEADEALDTAEIWATGEIVESGGLTFSDVVVTLERNPFEPDSLEFKYYARGFGLFRIEEGLDMNLMNPELVFTTSASPAPVPVPPALPLFGAAVAALFGLRGWRLSRRSAPVRG